MLSLCMIVKNEEHNIRCCLESALNVVDQIVLVDTGSTDSTLSIAKE
ncbi:glycosyltransferase, partial [Clostridium sp.]